MAGERADGARGQVVTPRAATPRRVLPGLLWAAVPALTAIVQFVRDAPLDGVVFALVSAALVVDLTGIVPAVRRLGRPATLPVIVGVVAVGAVLALSPRHGVVDGIVLAGLGITVAPVAWAGVASRADRHPRAVDPRALRRTAIAWAVTGVATCVWELTSFALGRVLPPAQALQHPAISDLLDPALDQPWSRAVFVAAWLALGLALVTRGRRD